MNPSQPTNSRNKNLAIVIISTLMLIVVGGIVYLIVNNQSNTTVTTEDDSNTYLEGRDIPTPPAKSERVVSATLEDTDTSHSITAMKVVINAFELPELYAVSDPARTVVLVEYTASNKGEYTGAPSGTKVQLVTEDGTTIESQMLTDDEMTQAGYEQMDQTGPKVGTSTTGYVAYLVPTEQASGEFSIRYVRPKTNVVFGDDLPEKTFEAKL